MMDYLFSVLDGLSWDDWKNAHNTVEEMLDYMWRDRQQMILSLSKYIEGICVPRITKTAELHSWELHRGRDYDVKLNQFLPYEPTGRASEGIHHHTRPLTTITLVGGYDQNYYQPAKDPEQYEIGERFGTLDSWKGPSTKPGHVYTIGPDVFHALTNFKDGTLTFAVYGKIVRHKITVFNTVTGLVEKRTTCTYAKNCMVNTLRNIVGSD